MNLAVKFENASKAKDDMRKAYEECNDIPKEKCVLIDICLKEESDKEYEAHNALFRKAEKLEKQINNKVVWMDFDVFLNHSFNSTDGISKLENVPQNEPSPDDTVSKPKKAAYVLTSSVVGMLLEFFIMVTEVLGQKGTAGDVPGRKNMRYKKAKLGNLLKYMAWLTRRSRFEV
uniref:Transcription factor TFIIE, alpha subunit, zinc finger, UBR-type n=1 Tax=Tanacetum cinerariifolium TaxID=118510 RepID=A0A6L2ME18_TANCI|nr:transcription factor TFIIE, alpha subunit, zinc finger, UBR-type [Tanacetum cinerariifolium]